MSAVKCMLRFGVALSLFSGIFLSAQTLPPSSEEKPQAHITAFGNADILSDTMGVDFRPYLNEALKSVRANWYKLIPEVARPPIMKKGNVTIECKILKDGTIGEMKLVEPSGDRSFDRAAWGGIAATNPFSPLPPKFGGQELALRFHFKYNPDGHELK